MAQHIPLKEEKEKKVFKQARDIVKYVNSNWKKLKESYLIIYRKKNIKILPAMYNPEGRAIFVSPFDLEDKEWDERSSGGLNLQKGASIEIHFNSDGTITNIFYPV